MSNGGRGRYLRAAGRGTIIGQDSLSSGFHAHLTLARSFTLGSP